MTINLDFEKHARTGRTTRMLEHAIKTASQLGKAVGIMARNHMHAGLLRHRIVEMVQDKEVLDHLRARLTFMSLAQVMENNIIRPGRYRAYDYGTNQFVRQGTVLTAPDYHVLIDHHALETHLANVILYLRTARKVKAHTQWLIDTARMLNALGRKIYVVTDDEAVQEQIAQAYLHPSISVEDGQGLENLDLLNQTLTNAHPNVQLLIEPAMLERLFAGALNEINRWNLK